MTFCEILMKETYSSLDKKSLTSGLQKKRKKEKKKTVLYSKLATTHCCYYVDVYCLAPLIILPSQVIILPSINNYLR